MNKMNCYDAMLFSAGNILLPCCDLNYYFFSAFSIKLYKGRISKTTYNDNVKRDVSFINILKDYYGFCVTKELIENRTLVEKKIEKIVCQKLRPIGIQMDSFYLPWNKLQYKMHRTHCFLITEILNNNYICIDTYLTDNKVLIDKKTLIDNIEWLFYFEYDEKQKKEKNINDIILYLQSYIAIEYNEHIEKIKEFANDIISLKFDTDINYDDIEQSSLIFCIANIEWNRNNFSKALKLAKNNFKTPLFDNIIPRIDEIYTMWGKVKSLMIKNIFTNNHYVKAGQLLQVIAEKEKSVMELILNICVQN